MSTLSNTSWQAAHLRCGLLATLLGLLVKRKLPRTKEEGEKQAGRKRAHAVITHAQTQAPAARHHGRCAAPSHLLGIALLLGEATEEAVMRGGGRGC